MGQVVSWAEVSLANRKKRSPEITSLEKETIRKL